MPDITTKAFDACRWQHQSLAGATDTPMGMRPGATLCCAAARQERMCKHIGSAKSPASSSDAQMHESMQGRKKQLSASCSAYGLSVMNGPVFKTACMPPGPSYDHVQWDCMGKLVG